MGKGSKPRPVNIKKYRNNWDEINWTTNHIDDTMPEIVEQAIRDSCEESRKQLEQAKEIAGLFEEAKQYADPALHSIYLDKITEPQPLIVKTPKGKAKRYVYR